MNLSPAPGAYDRNIWQQILNELLSEDGRNLKRDAAQFAAPVRYTAVLSPSQITGDQNNYSPTGLSTASILRLSTDAARTITGLAAQPDGTELRIYNVGSFNLTLANESASSTAANRFACGANALIAPGHGSLLWYDITSSRWRLIGRSNATFG